MLKATVPAADKLLAMQLINRRSTWNLGGGGGVDTDSQFCYCLNTLQERTSALQVITEPLCTAWKLFGVTRFPIVFTWFVS